MTDPVAANNALEVSPQAVRDMMERGEVFTLLDCRSAAEHALARLPGAILVPMDEFASRLESLREHEDSPIVVFCHHGRRSLHVVAAMRQYGFPDVKSLAGGIDRWSREIDPSIPTYS
jgi:rhodanese-related sulfurtransferase